MRLGRCHDECCAVVPSAAASASDARDIRACGCEWGNRHVMYRGVWMSSCELQLIVLLGALGVVDGDLVVGSLSDECGAW